jgi:hypothetical protein
MKGLHQLLAASHAKLIRGRVWCRACRRTVMVDSARCLALGWPRCCGATMTIDSPEESEELAHPVGHHRPARARPTVPA